MSQAIKYNPGTNFHPQLADELQKIKRALDNLTVLNGNVTIYSGQLAFVPNPTGPGEVLRFVANTPTSKQDYLAWYQSDNATRRAYFGFGNVNDEQMILAGETATSTISLRTNSLARVGITAAGTVQVGAPDTGNEAMQITGAAGGSALRVSPATGLTGVFVPIVAGSNQFGMVIDASAGGVTRAGIQLTAQNGTTNIISTADAAGDLATGSAVSDLVIRSTSQAIWMTAVNGVKIVQTLAVGGNVGFNGVGAQAASTGWGTPTGNATITNFPGATATLVQCSNVIAQLITQLKRYGLFGA
jgi:hypothetical protein